LSNQRPCETCQGPNDRRKRICSRCSALNEQYTNRLADVVRESLAIADRSKKLDTRLSRLSVATEKAKELRRLQALGVARAEKLTIPTEQNLAEMLEAAFRETVPVVYKEAMVKSYNATTLARKVAPLEKALALIQREREQHFKKWTASNIEDFLIERIATLRQYPKGPWPEPTAEQMGQDPGSTTRFADLGWGPVVDPVQADPTGVVSVDALPSSLRDRAKALRAIIRAARKAKTPHDEALRKLYELAVVEAGMPSGQYCAEVGEPSYNVRCIIPDEALQRVQIDYHVVGYRGTAALATDIKWFVEAWGEPRSSRGPAAAFGAVWSEAVRRYKSAKDGKDRAYQEAARTGKWSEVVTAFHGEVAARQWRIDLGLEVEDLVRVPTWRELGIDLDEVPPVGSREVRRPAQPATENPHAPASLPEPAAAAPAEPATEPTGPTPPGDERPSPIAPPPPAPRIRKPRRILRGCLIATFWAVGLILAAIVILRLAA
jgi:hypothetical protein